MPSARANISAKFMAQIEIGRTWAPRYRDPAAATRPTRVSISGRPAATSEPKAISMIARVTGQEITSERSIALLLAALKSDHIPDAPVKWTWVPSFPSDARGPLRFSAAATIAFASLAAPACTMAV